MSPRHGGFAGAGVATQLREALEWQQVQLALSPWVEGVTEKHPGRGDADARSGRSYTEAPAPGLASRSPSTRRTRSLRQHLPGAHCAPGCQDLGAQLRRRDTRPHGKRSHSARLPVQALLTGARRAPTSRLRLRGAGPTGLFLRLAPPPVGQVQGPAVGRTLQSTGNGVQLMSIKCPPTRGQPPAPGAAALPSRCVGCGGRRGRVWGGLCTPVGCQHCSLNESRASRRVISRATS